MTDDTVRVWLVERTFAEDLPNLIVLTYATPDGERDYRKERALQMPGGGGGRETTAALDVEPTNLGEVTDPETRERYATEAARMAEQYEPDEAV